MSVLDSVLKGFIANQATQPISREKAPVPLTWSQEPWLDGAHEPYSYSSPFDSNQSLAISANAESRKRYHSSSIPSHRIADLNMRNAPRP
jgi:hypothetical protein